MSVKRRKPDYSAAISLARSSRISNAVMCAVGAAVAVAAAIAGFFLAADYALLILSVCVTLLLPLTALLVKNLQEVRAVERIAKTGTYAAKLDDSQQEDIRIHLLRQGRQFYLTAFLVIATPEAAILILMSTLFKNDLFLLLMAIFSLAALSVAAIAGLYLSARLRTLHAFSTVSSMGVLTSREVLPFDARAGEVLSLIRFDDYYRIEFIKREILGIRRRASVIIPTDGVLKNGIDGNVDEVLARTLGLKRITVIHSKFYESRDYSEEAVNALASRKAAQDRA